MHVVAEKSSARNLSVAAVPFSLNGVRIAATRGARDAGGEDCERFSVGRVREAGSIFEYER